MPIQLSHDFDGAELARAAAQLISSRGFQCEKCGATRCAVRVGKFPPVRVRLMLVKSEMLGLPVNSLAMLCHRCFPDPPELRANAAQIARMTGNLFD